MRIHIWADIRRNVKNVMGNNLFRGKVRAYYRHMLFKQSLIRYLSLSEISHNEKGELVGYFA